MRELCTKHGAVLIFDEVMTGFRVGLKSAQGLFGITPDLSTFGKVVGGGMPLGAFGGKREIMEQIAPLGPVYQAGTLSGNPIATAAGLATLKLIQAPGFYEALTAKTKALCDGLVAAAKKHGVAFAAQNVGGMFGLYFAEKCPGTYDEVLACDKEAFNRFFHAMLDAGHYFAPSAFEAGFVSAAHSEADIAATIAAADAYFASTEVSTGSAWLILFVAGLCEIGWAVGLKYTEGFSRLWPSVATLLGMIASVVLLGWSLKVLAAGHRLRGVDGYRRRRHRHSRHIPVRRIAGNRSAGQHRADRCRHRRPQAADARFTLSSTANRACYGLP